MALQLLTAVIQAGLVGAAIYLCIRLVQAELADKRWWKEQMRDMQGKSTWKP